MDRHTFFPGSKLQDAINIDDHDSDDDDIDFEKYEVNLNTGDNKKKYKRVYDSKYKIPMSKKLHILQNQQD